MFYKEWIQPFYDTDSFRFFYFFLYFLETCNIQANGCFANEFCFQYCYFGKQNFPFSKLFSYAIKYVIICLQETAYAKSRAKSCNCKRAGGNMRKEFCEKDGILITYTNDNVCFEDTKTAESILLSNDGKILHSNFDDKKNQFYIEYLKQIYPAITTYRTLDSVETA